MHFILASSSQRRILLLRNAGFDFTSITSNFNEDYSHFSTPKSLAKRLAQAKAQTVAKHFPNSVILAADTLVSLGNDILAKPKSVYEALAMLKKLSGRKHTVITGFAIIDPKQRRSVTRAHTTCVWFRTLRKEEIEHYVKTKKPLDKSGGYGIQEVKNLFVEKIQGSEENVIGLPIEEVIAELKTFGIVAQKNEVG